MRLTLRRPKPEEDLDAEVYVRITGNEVDGYTAACRWSPYETQGFAAGYLPAARRWARDEIAIEKRRRHTRVETYVLPDTVPAAPDLQTVDRICTAIADHLEDRGYAVPGELEIVAAEILAAVRL